MSSVVSSDSYYVVGDGQPQPITGLPFEVSNHNRGINIDTRNTNVRLNLVIDGEGNDAIYASDESDFISTGLGNDIVHGGGGDDYIEGGDGNDFIRGGAGNDVISGGKGADILTGGPGSDTFIIEGSDLVDGSVDEIEDFTLGEDKLILQNLGPGNVSYDPMNGNVTLGNIRIAKLPEGLHPLDIEIDNLGGDGNWTLE